MSDLYQTELQKSKIYNTMKLKCKEQGDAIEASVIKLVNDIVTDSCNLSKTIIKYMPEFTLHDETHLFRVLLIMERMIPNDTLSKLSIPELMMLILCSFLHDIGMAPEEDKIRAWKEDWNDVFPNDFEKEENSKFNRFRNTYPGKIQEINKLRKNEEHTKANLIEDFIITEYIRTTHAIRAREIIANNWADRIIYKDKNLTYELTQLCFSHGNDSLSLLDLETNVLCGEDEYICLPFIGVILRLSDLLDFDAKRTPSILFSHLSVRNPVSLKEWQKHRSIQAWIIKNDKIAYSAQCIHPAIEKTINVFCNLIDKELSDASNVLSRISDDFRDDGGIYKIMLPAKVDRRKIQPAINIKTNEPLYIYRDTSFELSKEQIIDLLMGTKLYSDTKSALRELIQNSIDACLVAQSLCKKNGTLYSPEIIVRYYTDGGNDIIEVEDNGIGMNQSIIENYYAKVGSSYYKSKEFYDLKAQTGLTFQPISRFGIGILSCFMVSDTIDTKNVTNSIVKSRSKFSIHGIDFPDGIFPDIYTRSKKATLHWFLPVLLVVDIIGENDINLNSARTEIVYDENWINFEYNLAFKILSGLKENLEENYWNKLKNVLQNTQSSEVFLDALKQI